MAPLVAFLATFIGLLGPSREANKTGLHAITAFGWSSFALAAVSLCVALYLIHAKDKELKAARAAQQRLRSAVNGEVRDGLKLLGDVLCYAALLPYTTRPIEGAEAPGEIPYAGYRESHHAWDIDLHSKEVIATLENFYLSPAVRLKSPYIPSAVPFGTDLTRPSMR